MIFKKNTAITGFNFMIVNRTNGTDITTGTVTGYIIQDGGTGATLTNTPTYVTNAKCWKVDLTAAEMNADVIGLSFSHTSATTIHFTIVTESNKISELAALNATAVWGAGTRTLTSFGTLTTDTATAVWASGTRTLTSFGTLIADIWAYVTRTLSAGAITSTTFGTGAIDSNAIASDAITSAKIASSAITDTKLATGAITSAKFATDAISATAFAQGAADKVWSTASRTLTSFGTLVADTATAVWASLTSGMSTVGSIGKKLADWALGTDSKVLLSADSHSSGVAVASVTGNVGGNVNGNVGGSVTGSVGSVTGNVGGNVNGNVIGSTGSVTNPVTVGTINANALNASAIASGAITSAKFATDAIDANALADSALEEIENKVWDSPQSEHTGAGSFGKYLDAQVSSRLASSSYTDVSDDIKMIKYEGHGVYVDFISGTSGQVVGVNGTPDNPSSNKVDALALATALNFKKFILVGVGTFPIAYTEDYSGWTFEGENRKFTVVLMTDGLGAGPNVDFAIFKNVVLSGFQGGADYCIAQDCMLAQLYNLRIGAQGCSLVSDIQLGGNSPTAGGHRFFDCKSTQLSALGPIKVYFDNVSDTTTWFRGHEGRIEIHALGAGQDVAFTSHSGGVIIANDCTGGLVRLRGTNIYTDNSGGAVTLDLEGNLYRPDLQEDMWTYATRTLSSFGTLVADIATAVWGAVTRSLTDKADFTLTSAYDPAKTASQAGDAMALVNGAITSAKFATGAITADVIATDAIGADEISAGAVTKIQTGLATQALLQDVDDEVDAVKLAVDAIKLQTDQLVYFEEAVWIDLASLNTGTVVGVDGTPGNPVNSLSVGLTIAVATGLRKFMFLGEGTITLNQTYLQWTFESRGSHIIDVNDKDVSGCWFTGFTMTGTQGVLSGGAPYFATCGFDAYHGMSGLAEYCYIYTSLYLGEGEADLIYLGSYQADLNPVTIGFDSPTGVTKLNLSGYLGGFTLVDMTSDHEASIRGNGARMVVDASCSGGAINAVGTLHIQDNSGGAVTINYVNVVDPDYIATVSWNYLTSAMSTVGSIGKKLADWIIPVLGTDSKVLISSDSHTAGVAVASVTGNVSGNVTGSVGSLATQAKADVNAEVDQSLIDYDGGGGVAKESTVAGLKFTTPFNIIAPGQIVKPESGTTRYKFMLYYYDVNGVPADPDSNDIGVKMTNRAGGDENFLLFKTYESTSSARKLVDCTSDVNEGADSIDVGATLYAALSDDDPIFLCIMSGALVGGVSEDTKYYVTKIPATTTVTLSSSIGGPTLSLTQAVGTANFTLWSELLDASAYTDHLMAEKESTGVYSFFLEILWNETHGQFIYDFQLAVSATEYRYAYTHSVLDSAVVGVDLNDNVNNKTVVAEAFKSFDASGVTPVTGSIYQDFDTQFEGVDTAVGVVDGKVDNVPLNVWGYTSRTLTSFGTLVADTATAVWSYVTRALTDKINFALTSAYDPAKTASTQTSVNAIAGDVTSIKNKTDQIVMVGSDVQSTLAGETVTVGTNNDKTGYELTAGERTSIATAVWASATRTLTGFGTLVSDIATAVWGAVSRTLTDKTGFSLTSAYDPAKTASTQTSVDAIQSDVTAIKGKTNQLNFTGANVQATIGSQAVTVGTNNDKTGYELTGTERANIATAVWVATTRTLSSFGSLVSDISTSVWAYVSRTLTDKTGYEISSTNMDAIVDRVWDEAKSGHITPGTFGSYLDADVSSRLASASYYNPKSALDVSAYAESSVWIDTFRGSSGTVVGVNGIPSNPVDNIADARTIADAVGLRKYLLVGGSSIVLHKEHTDWYIKGIGRGIVSLNGQDVSESLFEQLGILGNQGGLGQLQLNNCLIQNVGNLNVIAISCGLLGTMSVSGVANYFMQCFSVYDPNNIPDPLPHIIFTNPSSVIGIAMLGYQGVVDLKSMTPYHFAYITTTGGEITINSNCVAGQITVKGVGSLINYSASPSVVIQDGDLIARESISASTWNRLNSAMTTSNSIGKKLADWVLGTDSKVLLSGNAQTGVTIPTVTTITNDVSIAQSSADKVWLSASRTLTSFGTLASTIVTGVWGALTAGMTTSGSIGKKLADWALGTDNKVLLSNNAQTGVTIPTVTTVTDGEFLPSDRANIVAIKSKTDSITMVGSDVQATLSGEPVTVGTNNDKTGYALTSGERTSIASAVWSYATRTITSGGITASEVWSYTTRSLTDKLGFSLTAGEHTSIAQAVWSYATRTITSGGITAAEIWGYATRTLTAGGINPADVWNYATRSLTDKLGFGLSSAYDSAKTAATQASVNTMQADVTAIKAKTAQLVFSDGRVMAVSDIDASAIQEIVDAIVADPAFKDIHSYVRGKVIRVGDTWHFYAEDNTTLRFSVTYTATERTPV